MVSVLEKKPFKDRSKIVTEEFDPDTKVEGSILVNPNSKDLECL